MAVAPSLKMLNIFCFKILVCNADTKIVDYIYGNLIANIILYTVNVSNKTLNT